MQRLPHRIARGIHSRALLNAHKPAAAALAVYRFRLARPTSSLPPQIERQQQQPRPNLYPARKMAADLRSVVSPAILSEVRDFWFGHINAHELVIPGADANKPWFFGGDEMDKICVARFAPTLEAIKASGVTSSDDLLAALNPQTPTDWLGLILLLDQMPRNCYRGSSSSIVFTYFDKLALGVAEAALRAGVPDTTPETRWQFAYRNWFFLPLQHSESREVHAVALREYELLSADMDALVSLKEAPDADEDGGYKRAAWEIVHKDVAAAEAFAANNMDFQVRHTALIDKFGRYPHRNEALGRRNTPAEDEHIANGGDSFGSGKQEA